MKKIVVTNSNERLDKYLVDILEESRATIAKMIDENYILVNANSSKSSYKVKENDEITIKDGFSTEVEIKPVKMNLDIVYEDDDLLIIDKPSGLTVHPGSGNYDNTLVNGLMYYTNQLSDINGEVRPGIVHRLDKDTSGLMVVAKNNKTHALLSEMFKTKKIKREYIALINGVFPHETATIDAPIGRDINDRKKMAITASNSKVAITHLKVLKRYKDYTLINLILETGRTHQIRVHLNYIGYPVYNDPVYSLKKATEFGQYLHSASISFPHPITNAEIHFKSTIPKEFQTFLDEISQIIL